MTRDLNPTVAPRQIKINADAAPLIAARLPFTSKRSTFRGTAVLRPRALSDFYGAPSGSYVGIGIGTRFSDALRAMAENDVRRVIETRGNMYLIHSYSQLIGWTRSIDHDGILVIATQPIRPYSDTTYRHMRIALSVPRAQALNVVGAPV